MRSLLRRFDDALNPIFVKEAYQGIRGREFLGLWLLHLLGVVAYALLVTWPAAGGERLLVVLMYLTAAIYTLIVVPQGVGSGLRSDIMSGTLETIALTRVTPWGVVSGRLQTALLRMLLVAAFAGPLAVALVLLGGVTWKALLATAGILVVGGVCQCAVVLMCNSFVALDPRLSGLARLAQATVVFVAVPVVFNLFGAVLRGSRFAAFGARYWLGGVATWSLVLAIALVAFCTLLTADVLTAPGVRKFARARLSFALLFLVVCVPPALASSLWPASASSALPSLVSYFQVLPVCALFLFCALVAAHRPISHQPSPGAAGRRFASHASYFAVLLGAVGAVVYFSAGTPVALWMGLHWVSYFVFCGGVATWIRGSGPALKYLRAFATMMIAGAVVAMVAPVVGKEVSTALLAFSPPISTAAGIWSLLPLVVGGIAAWRA